MMADRQGVHHFLYEALMEIGLEDCRSRGEMETEGVLGVFDLVLRAVADTIEALPKTQREAVVLDLHRRLAQTRDELAAVRGPD